MNESLNSNRLAIYSSQQRGKSNFVKRIGGVYSIKSVVLRPDFSRISGCVLRRSVCSHCAGLDDDDAKWSVWLKLSSIFNRTFKLSIFVMMSLPRHNHGQGYITYSLASARLYKPTCVPITCLALPPSWWGNVIEKRSFEAVLNLSDCLTNSK